MKIFVTRRIPQPALDKLSGFFDLEIHPKPVAIARKALLSKVKDADGLLCILTEKIDSELLRAAPRLKIVATATVGTDHIDLEAAARRGIPVTYTPGVLTETCADFTWALLLSAARRLMEGDRMMRRGGYKGWDPLMLLGTDVHGKTLGILGFGRIGQAVARRALGFQMKVLYYDSRRADPETEKSLNAVYADKETVLKESDFVSIHTVLDPSTSHLIGERELKMMKPSSYLINAARGPIVDEKALVSALKKGAIRGAALDVYEKEPRTAPGLAALSNVVLAPHLSSATFETRTLMGMLAADSLIDYLVHKKMPANTVNSGALQKASLSPT